jgi:uncharacterized integral membrane protein
MSLQNTGSPAGIDQPAPVSPPHHRIRRTRVGGVWVALAVSAVVLVLLLIFILENLKRADISLFGAHMSLPVGVALLLAAAAGALIVIIPGTARIVQLRMTARRHRRVDTQAAAAAPAAAAPAAAAPAADSQVAARPAEPATADQPAAYPATADPATADPATADPATADPGDGGFSGAREAGA